jgi:hypothetical protein
MRIGIESRAGVLSLPQRSQMPIKSGFFALPAFDLAAL